jgi:hypothetical protein
MGRSVKMLRTGLRLGGLETEGGLMDRGFHEGVVSLDGTSSWQDSRLHETRLWEVCEWLR